MIIEKLGMNYALNTRVKLHVNPDRTQLSMGEEGGTYGKMAELTKDHPLLDSAFLLKSSIVMGVYDDAETWHEKYFQISKGKYTKRYCQKFYEK